MRLVISNTVENGKKCAMMEGPASPADLMDAIGALAFSLYRILHAKGMPDELILRIVSKAVAKGIGSESGRAEIVSAGPLGGAV